MKKDAYYTSGQFAKKAHVTLRAIRYYDKQNILKPSYVSDAGARFYTDEDLARLQPRLAAPVAVQQRALAADAGGACGGNACALCAAVCTA